MSIKKRLGKCFTLISFENLNLIDACAWVLYRYLIFSVGLTKFFFVYLGSSKLKFTWELRILQT